MSSVQTSPAAILAPSVNASMKEMNLKTNFSSISSQGVEVKSNIIQGFCQEKGVLGLTWLRGNFSIRLRISDRSSLHLVNSCLAVKASIYPESVQVK